TWRGVAAEATGTAAQPQSATVATSTPSRAAMFNGRDSYSDVVKLVSAGVVTVRVEGRAKMEPTAFGGGDDQDQQDMLRRFFGEQFGQRGQQQQGPRSQRAPRQRGLGS